MLLAESGCVFMGLILFISGVQGRANSICALKGSSVELPCSAKRPNSSMKWYKIHMNESTLVQNELSADENHVMYHMPKERNFTLTIKDLKESDEHNYCCAEDTDQPLLCLIRTIQLHVADLQVKVIPTTEGQTVTLMCTTSCPLTEKPAAYIWYKNREFLYQDWSPWYQQLVSSDEAVTYSCAVKGYEDLRAPEVSVDSVTSTCFNVTYAKGRMCSYNQTSVDEPCSITYPTELHVQKTPAEKLTCRTSCPLINSQTTFKWYRGGYNKYITSRELSVSRPSQSWKMKPDRVSCAVKDNKDLLSAEVCRDDKNCWSVNYVSRRICALEGSSMNISSEYLHPENQQPKSKDWYKIERSSEEEAEELTESPGRVEYHDNMKNLHILRIKNLKKNDSAEYRFILQKDRQRKSNFPGVTLFVTGLTVKFTPSAEVTEGQRVTLTCSTSCPLTDNTNYTWYKNSRRLTLTENQHKHLVLDPVSSQHAGRYSCAVKTHISSRDKTLTVESKTGMWTSVATKGVCAALLVIVPLTVFLCIRSKRTSSQSPTSDVWSVEQFHCGTVYDNIVTPPTDQNFHRSRVYYSKNQTPPLPSTVQTPQPAEQEQVHYAVVNFRHNRTPE